MRVSGVRDIPRGFQIVEARRGNGNENASRTLGREEFVQAYQRGIAIAAVSPHALRRCNEILQKPEALNPQQFEKLLEWMTESGYKFRPKTNS